MRKLLIFILAAIFIIPSSACSMEYADLNGEWVQSNSHNNGSFHGINISDDYIEIYWVFDNMNGATLYWAGTFETPTVMASRKFDVVAHADTSRTMLSVLASGESTKTFTYNNGKLTYDVDYTDVTGESDYRGMVMPVTAERGSWGMESQRYRGIIDMFDVAGANYQDPWGNSMFAEYHVGDIWEVPGEWSLQITDASITTLRNPSFSLRPGAVYEINYTYTNIGWSDDNDGGLQFLLDDNILDINGGIGYSYPLSTDHPPKQVNEGETCVAQDFIAVTRPGTFKVLITKRDSSGDLRGAVFIIDM